MLITRETDYALRLLSALSSGGKYTTEQLCEQELTPKQFGYKILKKLAKAGYIDSSRGNGGGCTLSCDLQEVTLYDLMMAMGEDVHISACFGQGYICKRNQKLNNRCTIHHNLESVQRQLDEELKKYSPDVTIISTEKAFMLMRQFGFHIDDYKIDTVKEGDTRCFGTHTVTFIAAPMVHWPEAMLTFESMN